MRASSAAPCSRRSASTSPASTPRATRGLGTTAPRRRRRLQVLLHHGEIRELKEEINSQYKHPSPEEEEVCRLGGQLSRARVNEDEALHLGPVTGVPPPWPPS